MLQLLPTCLHRHRFFLVWAIAVCLKPGRGAAVPQPPDLQPPDPACVRGAVVQRCLGFAMVQKGRHIDIVTGSSEQSKSSETIVPTSTEPHRQVALRFAIGQLASLWTHKHEALIWSSSDWMPHFRDRALKDTLMPQMNWMKGGNGTIADSSQLPFDTDYHVQDRWDGVAGLGAGESGSLPLELHLPAVSLKTASAYGGSLAGFMEQLGQALSTAAKVPRSCIAITGIYERFRETNGNATPYNGSVAVGEREVLVHLSAQSDGERHVDPQKVVDDLRDALGRKNSELMESNIGPLLQNSTISLRFTTGLPMTTALDSDETRNLNKLSVSMALPIGISALFTAILVWLAAA